MKKRAFSRLFAGVLAAAMIVTTAPAGSVISAQAAAKTVTVSTQKQLDRALKNKKVTNIVIKTDKKITIKVKAGKYSKVKLVVDAKNANVVNNGAFKDVAVKDAVKFMEVADNNKISVTDKSLNFVVSKKAEKSQITLAGTGSKVNMVTNGKPSSVNVNKKAKLNIKGASTKTIRITVNAEGSAVTTAVKTSLTLNKEASVIAKKGAVISAINAKKDADIQVESGATVGKIAIRGTGAAVTIKADGVVKDVTVQAKADVSLAGATDNAVTVTVTVADAAVKSEIKTDVVLKADADVTLAKGAEGSTVKVEDGAKADVTNGTTEKVVVTDEAGKTTEVGAGTNAQAGGSTTDTNTNTNTPSGGSSGTPGGSTGGSTTPEVTVPVITAFGGTMKATSGASVTTTGAFSVTTSASIVVTSDSALTVTLAMDTPAYDKTVDGTTVSYKYVVKDSMSKPEADTKDAKEYKADLTSEFTEARDYYVYIIATPAVDGKTGTPVVSEYIKVTLQEPGTSK